LIVQDCQNSRTARSAFTKRSLDTSIVISGPFLKNFPCNHIINIKKKSFSGEVKDSVIFPFYFLLHKRAKTIQAD